MTNFKAKNAELYLFVVATPASFTPGSRATNKTLAKYCDDQYTGNVLSGKAKISSTSTEVKIEPAENTVSNRKFFGSDTSGSQNTETVFDQNMDLDITLTTDDSFEGELAAFGLTSDGITNSTYANYKGYNLANSTSNQIGMLVRIHRLIGTTHYYKNIVVNNPVFKKMGENSGNADDPTLTAEYSLFASKSNTYKDYYSGTTAETLTNF